MLPSRHIWVSPRFQIFFRLFWLTESSILAGADTTASAIGTFFLAMVCYPQVQKAAQAELDNVLNGRLPEHSDIVSLPYILALVKEVYRYAATCSFASGIHFFIPNVFLVFLLILDGSL